MRKPKRDNKIVPFASGLASGYIVTLALSAAAALLLLLSGSAEALSGAVSVIVMAVSCFFAGRTAGKLRRRSGLKSGALCGLLYFAPLVLLGVIFRTIGGLMLIVKLLLCVAFAAAGGVVGVNSET